MSLVFWCKTTQMPGQPAALLLNKSDAQCSDGEDRSTLQAPTRDNLKIAI